MRILDVLTSPWAIIPEKLYEIQEIYNTHLKGDKIDVTAFDGGGNGEEDEPYQIINETAIIPIQGVIAKKMNMFSRISGGVSTQLLGRDIQTALSDPNIKGIILDIDSPGGTVDGTQELGDIIFEGRKDKPIIAYSDGMMASGAYWLGSAAQEIYISGDTIHVGSIGVVSTHVDYSEYEKKRGIKTTEVYAGKYKRITSQYEPLSGEGRENIQGEVDYLYSVFVDTVAKHRGVSNQTVLDNMADGRTFIGKQSIEAGLVDGVSTFDKLVTVVIPVVQSQEAEKSWLKNLNEEMKNV